MCTEIKSCIIIITTDKDITGGIVIMRYNGGRRIAESATRGIQRKSHSSINAISNASRIIKKKKRKKKKRIAVAWMDELEALLANIIGFQVNNPRKYDRNI